MLVYLFGSVAHVIDIYPTSFLRFPTIVFTLNTWNTLNHNMIESIP